MIGTAAPNCTRVVMMKSSRYGYLHSSFTMFLRRVPDNNEGPAERGC